LCIEIGISQRKNGTKNPTSLPSLQPSTLATLCK
jgi:hypothetical protein